MDQRIGCAVFFFVLIVPGSLGCIFRPLLAEQAVFGPFTDYVQEWFVRWIRWYGFLNLLAYFALVCWLIFGTS
jgi:hypothetical protein